MNSWLTGVADSITRQHLINAALALAFLLAGSFLARRGSTAVGRLQQLDSQQRMLLGKIVHYGIFSLAIVAALSQLGVDIKVLLGAAGVITVAVGFAAQTSASNLISGLFLMVERPFVVGDVIAVGDPKNGVMGEVMSIDLLSSKIRTFSNLMIRVPNESLVKANIHNYSYFPLRRLDFNFGVALTANLSRVEALMRQAATSHPLCLEDPQPVFVVNGFGDFSISLQFQVWTMAANMGALQNELYRDIKIALDRAGVDIPYPTRTMITAAHQQPRA